MTSRAWQISAFMMCVGVITGIYNYAVLQPASYVNGVPVKDGGGAAIQSAKWFTGVDSNTIEKKTRSNGWTSEQINATLPNQNDMSDQSQTGVTLRLFPMLLSIIFSVLGMGSFICGVLKTMAPSYMGGALTGIGLMLDVIFDYVFVKSFMQEWRGVGDATKK